MQLILLLLALVAALFGALSGNTGGLVLAAFCIFLSASGLVQRTTAEQESQLARGIERLAGEPWFLLMVAALLFAGSAALLAGQDPFNRSNGFLWLLSLLLILAAGWLHDRSIAVEGRPILYAHLTWDRLDWLAVGVLSVVALVLRLYRLGDFLPAMSGDEGEMGLLALHALRGTGGFDSPQPLPFFSTAFLDHPTLFHYVQAGALWLFGETLSGLRLLSVIVGALCVPLLYLVARAGWGRAAALTAGWLLAISHLPIHYSRIALNNIESVWFMIALVLLLFLVRGERDAAGTNEANAGSTPDGAPPRILSYVLIGLVIGLSQYFYYGSRLLPVVAVAAFLYLWRARQIVWVQLITVVVAGAVAFGPLALYYTRNSAGFVNRMRGINVFSEEGLVHTLGPDARWPADMPRLFWVQVTRNVDFFVDSGDRSAFYLADLPAFDPVSVLLFWVGLGLAAARVRRFHELILFSWLVLGTLLAGVLTNDAPNGPRLLLVLPAAYLMAGLTVQQLFDFTVRHSLVTVRKGMTWVGAGVAVALCVFHFRTYFVVYAHFAAQSIPINIAHDMVTAGDSYRSYLFGAPYLFADYGVMRFVARDTERHDAVTLADLPLPADGADDGKGLLIFALPHSLATLDQVERRYPGGVRRVHLNDDGDLLYATYRLDPGAMADHATGAVTR